MIKAVFFDVDDTLYSQQQAFNGAYKELLEGKYEISRDVLYKRFWMKSVFTESFILWGTMDCLVQRSSH